MLTGMGFSTDSLSLKIEVYVDGAWRPGKVQQVHENESGGDVQLDVVWRDDEGTAHEGRFPAGRVRITDDE